jgi:flagellar protein FliO/FliZ
MSTGTTLASVLWFLLILALIPTALWLLKRTPIGGAGMSGGLRQVASLALSPNQRVVAVEVGEGDERRWLVLGVTPASIATLHVMTDWPGAAANANRGGAGQESSPPPFAHLLKRLSPVKGNPSSAERPGDPT